MLICDCRFLLSFLSEEEAYGHSAVSAIHICHCSTFCEDSNVWGCYAMSANKYLQTFLKSVAPPPSDSGSLKTYFILPHAIVVFNLLKQI